MGVCGEEASDILDHDQSGLQVLDGGGHVRPEAGAVAVGHAAAHAGEADVLAWEAAGEDVDRAVLIEGGGPVDGGDVAKVGYAGPVVGEDPGGVLGVGLAGLAGRLVLGVPGHGAAEDFEDGQVQAAHSGEK
jgi:hypothetical protein